MQKTTATKTSAKSASAVVMGKMSAAPKTSGAKAKARGPARDTQKDKQKTDTISARIKPALKQKTSAILNDLGLSYSEAITLFLSQVALHRGLPFEVKIPNAVTLQAMQDVADGKNLTRASSVKELRKMLDL